MTPQAQIQQILLLQIDQDDLEFRFSPLAPVLEEDSALADSVRRVGILHPPILRKRLDDRYLMISGHTRVLLAGRILGLGSLPCLVLPATCDDALALEVAFEALCARKVPTPMEVAFFCQRMAAHLGIEEIAARFFPRLGLPPTPFLVRQAIGLAGIEEPFAVAIHQGRLHEAVGRELMDLPLPDRLALFELIDLLQLSVGNQKKLVAGCRELSGRENVSLRSILGSAEIRDILDHQEMNIPQKGAALMRYLTARRFPQLTAAAAEFEQFRRGLALPDNFSLEATPSFEDDRLRLTITFAGRQELNRRLPALLADGH
ncbi:ParB/RepB/Spo0J family partition protein [Desulfurivibrio sp. D14AmB]|uniref:ParB/RepB/Spo0J family partition protein n=1 Tax=Desulfurivibrio sp. D14AmB TaxID=3374370 RepID=UPI00376ED975